MNEPPDEVKVQIGQSGKIVTIRTVEGASPSFYVNNATFTFTEWDFRIDLSEIQNVISEGEGEAEETIIRVARKARIVMAVPYAKQFADALVAGLRNHDLIRMQAEKEKSASDEQPAQPQTSPETAE